MKISTESKEYYDIVNGPNRDVLFDACKYTFDKNATIVVNFIVAIDYTMPKGHPDRVYIPMAITDITIYGISHENASGESFNLEGHCQADLDALERSHPVYRPYRFKAFYLAESRKGKITFED